MAFSPHGQGQGQFSHQLQVPTNMLGRIIGAGGSTVQQLQKQCQVKVNIPKKDQQQGPMQTITISGLQPNVLQCVQAIQQLLSGQGGNASAGPGGQGGRVPRGVALIFRVEATTKSLQVLLQRNKKGLWGLPSGRLDQPGDDVDGSKRGMARILAPRISNGLPSSLDQLHWLEPARDADGTVFYHHILVPPTPTWSQWLPAGTSPDLATSPGEQLYVGGIVPHSNGISAWVDVERFKQTSILDCRDIKNWMSSHSQTEATIRQQFQVQGVQWTTTEKGQKLLENFFEVTKFLQTQPPDKFQQIVGACFSQAQILDLLASWKMGGGPLKHEL